MTDPIQAAIAQAAEQAKANPIPANTAVATVSGTAVVPQKLTMESMAAGAMAVDKWLKVNENGLHLGDSGLIVVPVLASIDMTEGSGFVLKYAIKGGNPAQYAYTTDMVNAVGGGTWEAAQARIRALQPGQNPYRAVDLPFTLEEEVKDVKGAVAGKPGDLVGYTTSTTNWANWDLFFKECAKEGLLGQRVLVKLSARPRTNKNNNKWGVVAFELQGAKE